MCKSALRFFLVALCFGFLMARAALGAAWVTLRTAHFEIYSETPSEPVARQALQWFEQLRTFFNDETGLKTTRESPTRIIGFSSTRDYDPYRLGPTAHAYYIGAESRDYIVLPGLGRTEFRPAAHEYAHLLLHRGGEKWPLWLNEGLAEFYSTIRINKDGTTVGGDIAAHTRTLNRKPWITLQRLASMTHSELWSGGSSEDVFYAESWALTDMLLFSPGYGSNLRQFLAAFDNGDSAETAFRDIYRKRLTDVERDLHAWTEHHPETRMEMPAVPAGIDCGTVQALSDFESQVMLADLLAAMGELDRSKQAYSRLASERPHDGSIHAALGTIALRERNYGAARDQWRLALENGVQDADLCFRYANLADSVELSKDQIREALQRAIAIRPGFDDARYKLALLESNAGEFDAAVTELRAMRQIARNRRFAYWTALSYALTETGKWDDALAAANEAKKYATNEAERAQASNLAYVSQTDLTVQFTTDAAGHLRLATTRVPRGTTNWNPFILPDDQIRTVEGKLTHIACANSKATGILVESGSASLFLAIVNPKQIQVQHSTGDFICGPQTQQPLVSVQYAMPKTPKTDAAIVRGIDFR